jgi:PTS system mannose-specific IIC component
MLLWKIALAGVWGGLLAVERKAFLQAMFSRPLVAATGVGLISGDVLSGLGIGMVLELFYLGSASLGASLPENDTLAATSAAAFSAGLASHTGSTPAIWSLSILLMVGLGRAGRILERKLEIYSARLAQRALASAEKGEVSRAVRQNLFGMWPVFVVFTALTALSAVVGKALAPILEHPDFPLRLLRGLAWAYPAIASVAAAIAVRGSNARRSALYAGMAAAAVTVTATVMAIRRGGFTW